MDEETALRGDKRKLYAGIHNAARDWLIRNSQERSSVERRQKGSLRLTSAGKQWIKLWSGSHDAISSLAVVTLHYSTLRPIQVALPRLPLLGSHSHKFFWRRGFCGNEGPEGGLTLLEPINKNITTTRHLRVTHPKIFSPEGRRKL